MRCMEVAHWTDQLSLTTIDAKSLQLATEEAISQRIVREVKTLRLATEATLTAAMKTQIRKTTTKIQGTLSQDVFDAIWVFLIRFGFVWFGLYVTTTFWFNLGCIFNGTEMNRTSSVPMSVLRLLVDKGQGLRSGILCFTSVVLPPKGMLSRELKIILFRCWWLSLIKSMSLFINVFNSFILDWHKYRGFSSRFSLEGHTNIKYLLYVDLSSSMKNSWNDYSFTLIAKKC